MSRPIEFDGHPWSYGKRPPTYRAVCKRVKDGDTFEMFVDFGLRKYGYEDIRLRGVDTPELSQPRNAAELAHAQEAKAFVAGLIEGKHVIITTYTDTQTYGRFVATVAYYDAIEIVWRDVGTAIIANGLAKRKEY